MLGESITPIETRYEGRKSTQEPTGDFGSSTHQSSAEICHTTLSPKYSHAIAGFLDYCFSLLVAFQSGVLPYRCTKAVFFASCASRWPPPAVLIQSTQGPTAELAGSRQGAGLRPAPRARAPERICTPCPAPIHLFGASAG